MSSNFTNRQRFLYFLFQVYLTDPVDRETLNAYALTIDVTDGSGMVSGFDC